MKFHDELNPKLWDKNNDKYTLKPKVENKLNEIASVFIDYLDIPADAIKDVVITGSSANYNYTPQSDLDLHLRVDYEKVHEDCPIVEGYLWSMKAAFNKDHDISIYGVPVEVYAEDYTQPAISNGVYSLMEEKWLKEPKQIPPTDNDLAVQAKFNELKEASDRTEDSEVAQALLDKIYKMRKSGLAQGGEFSTENMAFKLLRNTGAIDRLKQLKKEEVDKNLTLESYVKPNKDEVKNGAIRLSLSRNNSNYGFLGINDKDELFTDYGFNDAAYFANEEEAKPYIERLTKVGFTVELYGTGKYSNLDTKYNNTSRY